MFLDLRCKITTNFSNSIKKTYKNFVISYNFCNFAVSNFFYMRKTSLISCFLLFSSLFTHAQSNYFEYLTAKDGLSDYSINGLYEDEFARMWIATRNGLNCYDGQRFRVWSAVEGMHDTYVRRVVGDKNGHLLILTRAQAFVMNLHTEQLTALPIQHANAIAGSPFGLFMATSDTLYRILTQPAIAIQPILASSEITAIAPVDNQAVWVAGKEGVQLFRNGHATSTRYATIHQVAQLMVDSRNNLWVCTREDGLYLISAQQHLTHFTAQSARSSSLTDNDVRCITEDALGNYWIGLYGGLCHLNLQTDTIERYEYDPRAEHALSTFSVWALTTDRQGTVWIGTYFGGIDLINPQHSIYTYYGAYGKEGHRLSNPIVTGSCCDDKGNLWIGTNGGGLNVIDHSTHKIEYIRIDQKEPQNAIKSMWLDNQRHRLWLGTHRGGLRVVDTQTRRISSYPLPERNMRKLIAFHDTLLVMTQHTIYSINLHTMQFSPLIASDIMPNIKGELSDMAQVRDTLWFAYSNHLFSYALLTHRLQSYPFDANITVLHADEKKGLMIGTDIRGVWHRTNNGFAPTDSINQELPSPYIMSIASHHSEYMVATNISVSILDEDWQVNSILTSSNGFPLEVIVEHSGAIYNDKVLIGGVNGLVLFPLHSTLATVQPSALQLSNILIDNENVKIDTAYPFVQTIQLQPHQHSITLQVTTSGIVTRRNSQVRYRLKDYDYDWITTGNKALITYTNLPKGKYILEIECVGTDLHREITIQVLPHWYNSWWAWILYLSLGVVALIAALIYFEQYIERKTRKQLNEHYQQDLQRATTIVLNHLADDAFNVQQFAKEMYVSRTGLYTKLQEIAGQTPNDFILSIRMREAATLLWSEPEMSIVEISARVGFNSASYFIKCFHRMYGKSPSAWRKEKESRA